MLMERLFSLLYVQIKRVVILNDALQNSQTFTVQTRELTFTKLSRVRHYCRVRSLHN